MPRNSQANPLYDVTTLFVLSTDLRAGLDAEGIENDIRTNSRGKRTLLRVRRLQNGRERVPDTQVDNSRSDRHEFDTVR